MSRANSDAKMNGLKVLSCVFFDDVLCSLRKSEKSTVMDRCMKCPHYLRFVCEMEKEEDEFFDYVERVRRGESRL